MEARKFVVGLANTNIGRIIGGFGNVEKGRVVHILLTLSERAIEKIGPPGVMPTLVNEEHCFPLSMVLSGGQPQNIHFKSL